MKTRKLDKEWVGGGQFKGFKYKMVYEDGPYRIYEVNTGHTTFYEPVKIRTVKAKPDKFESHSGFDYVEVYPSSSSWGVYGFTCHSYDLAMSKVESMKSNEKMRALQQN